MKNYTEYNPDVTAERLRNGILEAGMSQREFREKIECTKYSLDKYLEGTNTIPLKKLFKIALELGFTADYLIGLTDENLT